jgi:hypothetical protein
VMDRCRCGGIRPWRMVVRRETTSTDASKRCLQQRLDYEITLSN